MNYTCNFTSYAWPLLAIKHADLAVIGSLKSSLHFSFHAFTPCLSKQSNTLHERHTIDKKQEENSVENSMSIHPHSRST